jgi:hypothetical protein
MTRQELEQALQLAYAQHQATQQELATERERMQKMMLRTLGLGTTLHEMTEALSSLLLLHLQRKPIEVYELLSTLSARYVHSTDAQNLAALSQAAGQVH